MAQLKSLIVNGSSRFIGDVFANTFTGNLSGNATTATSATSASTAAALTGYTIKSMTATGSLGWTSSTADAKILITNNVVAYWNGAYNSNNASNLTYCAAGTIIGSNSIGNQSVKYATYLGSASESCDYSTLNTLLTNKAEKNHTHSYAGSSSAGGAATSANKLNTNAGSSTLPVYFSNGVPVAISSTGVAISITGNAKTADSANRATIANSSEDTVIKKYDISTTGYYYGLMECGPKPNKIISGANVAGAVALGVDNTIAGNATFVTGVSNFVSGTFSTASGYLNNAIGNSACVRGQYNCANGSGAIAIGTTTSAIGTSSIAAGGSCVYVIYLTGSAGSTTYSYTLDDGTLVGNAVSLIVGNGISISGVASYVTAIDTTNKTITVANTLNSDTAFSNTPARLNATIAQGDHSHAIGYGAIAKGMYSSAIGKDVITNNESEIALGYFNQSNSTTLFSIGNGTSTSARSNAFEVTINGDGIFAGAVTAGSFVGNATNSDAVDGYHILVMTQSEYASVTKATNTIYLIRE